ncbi:unnamed protein product [Urochloa decumbens]|uniref:Uncharacterized protein n=1 Tax=Urochloa decumbens TaxID=240449 RepID=A0ABC9G0D9_9POAL
MDSASPPAGGTPARPRNLAGLWRTRQAGNKAFRHLMNLIGVLSTVEPNVVEDPAFLERSVLVDGVAPTMSPNDLLQSFNQLSVTAAVLVRDDEIGHRVGLVVFSAAPDCTSATNMEPPQGFHYCVSALIATGAGHSQFDILDALDNNARRSPDAELFRSLIPPEYLGGDTERDFHLRCVFLGGPVPSVVGGVSHLSRIGTHLLRARAPTCAVIVQRARHISVLVYDEALSTEVVGLRTSKLLHQCGLVMYDSSLYPLPAGAHAEETSLVLRLLPPFLTAAEHLGRVVLLTGLDTEVCDARDIAHDIESSLSIGGIESVIIHRTLGAVLVVLRSTRDAEALVREAGLAAFRLQQPIQCLLEAPPPQPSAPEALEMQLSLRRFFSAQTVEYLSKWVKFRLENLDDGGAITGELIRLCALHHPDVALRGRHHFSNRAVLLSGVSPGATRTGLRRFGALEALALYPPRSVALGVFQSWTGAARLLREPAGSWALMGFGDSRLAPGAQDAGDILDEVLNLLVSVQSCAAARFM